jgi:hypothetical protein
MTKTFNSVEDNPQNNPTSFPARPRWADEEPIIAGLLDTFLHKLEKGNRLSLRVNSKTLPELFDFDAGETQYLWSLIKHLDNEFHLLSIQYDRTKPYQEVYENAKITFNEAKEELVRHWLNRPALDPYALVWQNTLAKLAHKFEDGGLALVDNPVRLADYGPEETLRAFAKLSDALKEPVTLRALSARCFWGDSKFLDHREELIRALFPHASQHITPRKVLINVKLSPRLEQILFIENQDTFLAMSELNLDHITLVYSAGFRAASQRVRDEDSVSFSYVGQASSTQNAFEGWWAGNDPADKVIPVYFWGDLDYAGLAILKTLKQTFTEILAWQPGYRLLLEHLQRGHGHGHDSSGKSLQRDSGLTGCRYADEILRPAIIDTGLFIDQEVISLEQLNSN